MLVSKIPTLQVVSKRIDQLLLNTVVDAIGVVVKPKSVSRGFPVPEKKEIRLFNPDSGSYWAKTLDKSFWMSSKQTKCSV